MATTQFQTFTGKEYLKIDIANNYGQDKKKWRERISWFDENQDKLEDLIKDAEEPALFFAGVQAWRQVERGEPIGYPVSLDATSSGLQLLACLTGDRKAAELCNVVDFVNQQGGLDFSPEAEAERRDGYTVIYNYMTNLIGEKSKIAREDVKQAIMTSLYGSEAVPKEVFGEGNLLAIFHEVMSDLAPGAWELNKAFLSMWNPNATIYEWTMPDNFHVKTKVMDTVKNTIHFLNAPYEVLTKVNQAKDEGRSLGANSTHSVDGMVVREVVRRCNYDKEQLLNVKTALCEKTDQLEEENEKSRMLATILDLYKRSGLLSMRIVDFIDCNTVAILTEAEKEAVWRLLSELPTKPFEVLTVHDCFRVLPNYGNDLRKQYNHILSHIAKSNMLEFLIEQITGKQIKISKLDPEMWKDVLTANYSLS